MAEAHRPRSERLVVRRLESIEVFCGKPDLCARQLRDTLAMLAFCCVVGAVAGVQLVAALIGPAGVGGHAALILNALVVGLSAWAAGALVAKAFFYYALLYAPEAVQDELQARLASLRQGRRPMTGRREIEQAAGLVPSHTADEPRAQPSPPPRILAAHAP